ncbi:MAG: hypothetical protein JRF33_17625 [Deltaproteobacteria bacterium]|nr:hypothetical protein [Deltaproteobacteria bacterium]
MQDGLAQCVGGGGCIELVYAGALDADEEYAGLFHTLQFTPALGDGVLLDFTQFEFYANDTGSIDLASAGVNDNYRTCSQCMVVLEDIAADGSSVARYYFQESGSMVVSAGTPPQEGSLDVTLTDVTLVEVTIDAEYNSTPVAGGQCLHITAATLSTGTVACVEGATQCAGNVIQTCTDGIWADGTDCGDNNETCGMVDGTAQCQAAGVCIELTYVDGLLVADVDYPSMYANDGYTPDLGGVLPDWHQFEFYDGATGVMDLGDAVNGNYISCSQCIRFFEDIDEGAGTTARQYFQQSGTMTIAATSDPLNGTMDMVLADVTLVEVTIAADYTSTPVAGGQCLHITAATLSTSGTATCIEGETQCAGEVIQTCTGGAWADGTDCNGNGETCEMVDGDAVCVAGGICTDGETQCVGTVIQTCTGGAWADGADCSDDGDICNMVDGDATCVAAGTCLELTYVDGLLVPDVEYPSMYSNDGYTPDLGGVLPDWHQFEFYDGTTGAVDLGDATNGNYISCMQCVRFFEDIDEGAGTTARQYFQESGSMVIDAGSDPENGSLDMTLTDVTLIEVTVAADFTSTPVPGGQCLHITSAVLSSTPVITCDAPVITAGSVINGDTCTGNSFYNPGTGGCTGYSANANELLYELTVPAGASYQLDLAYSDVVDASLWATSDCLDTAGASCVDGADANTDGTESLTLTAGTYYVVVDGYTAGTCGNFALTVTAQ